MSVTKEIFNQYVSMRKSGLEMNSVLHALRPYIHPLSKVNRQDLARSIRDWENEPSAEPEEDDPSIKSEEPVVESPEGDAAEWLSCPHCGKKNRINAVFCYACGLMLTVSRHVGTRHFTDRLIPKNDFFGAESVLVLKVQNIDLEYEIRPQASSKGIFLGRRTAESTVSPDVALNEAGAERQGVSRLHMAIKYDAGAEALQVFDLGSVNGSFINGQKLHHKEIRVLRDGDEITLGRLVMRADFHHPGDEIG
jgi:hypothetical protein